MSDNKKSNVWLYAVILFTSAFIVLLFAGLSQIKMNKNLNDYKSQVNNSENEKNKYQQNFSSAQEMNQKLNDQIAALENETLALKSIINNLNSEKTALNEAMQNKDQAEENFHSVLSEYLKGNVTTAAGLIALVDSSELSGKDLEAFNALDLKVRSEAGKILYDEGYRLYRRGKYTDAVVKLSLSFGYAKKEDFSDRCLYYLAWAEKSDGNKAAAVDHMKQLVQEYPESSFSRIAKSFIKRYS